MAICFPSVPGHAAAPQAPAFAMPETEVWDMQSRAGVTYRIFVSRPEGKPPPQGYPVLFVLDANAMFAGFAEARRIHSGFAEGRDKMIVVGIGYPVDKPYADRRMEDFTPPFRSPKLAALYKDYEAGGREAFLDFITERLAPEIDGRYDTNLDRQSLYGHSLGGLFALYALYEKPEYFHAVIAASPSIWWDDQAILNDEAAFTQRLRSAEGRPQNLARLHLQVGELEGTSVTVSDSIALARRLESLTGYGLRSSLEVFDDEIHLTVPSRSVTPSLRAALDWP
jgi:predicted alpha/beta superfamily hydrolase